MSLTQALVLTQKYLFNGPHDTTWSNGMFYTGNEEDSEVLKNVLLYNSGWDQHSWQTEWKCETRRIVGRTVKQCYNNTKMWGGVDMQMKCWPAALAKSDSVWATTMVASRSPVLPSRWHSSHYPIFENGFPKWTIRCQNGFLKWIGGILQDAFRSRIIPIFERRIRFKTHKMIRRQNGFPTWIE